MKSEEKTIENYIGLLVCLGVAFGVLCFAIPKRGAG